MCIRAVSEFGSRREEGIEWEKRKERQSYGSCAAEGGNKEMSMFFLRVFVCQNNPQVGKTDDARGKSWLREVVRSQGPRLSWKVQDLVGR